jgi:hypothetical protein
MVGKHAQRVPDILGHVVHHRVHRPGHGLDARCEVHPLDDVPVFLLGAAVIPWTKVVDERVAAGVLGSIGTCASVGVGTQAPASASKTGNTPAAITPHRR